MSAVIMEYKYEHAPWETGSYDAPEMDHIVISVFDVEIKRLEVPAWKYFHDGERTVCEDAIIEWLKGSFK